MERKSGVLMHVSSLWGDYSCGSFGKAAKEFVDFLSAGGFSYWQVLPFGLVDECNSPYKSYSTFGGNPYFVDLESLFEERLITSEELNSARQNTPYSCEFERLSKKRANLLLTASKRVNNELRDKINSFIDNNSHLKDFCRFMALKSANEDAEWVSWSIKDFDEDIEFGWRFIQFEFLPSGQKLKITLTKKESVL